MIRILIYTFLFSISPFGEARVGIPYAIINDIHVLVAFTIGFIANALIYPLMIWLMNTFNKRLWPYKPYKWSVVRLSRIAKKSAGSKIDKYGFWGLMIFVMIPLPGTGAYMGTIAAALFKLNHKDAFLAITLGVFISCIIVAAGVYFGILGLNN